MPFAPSSYLLLVEKVAMPFVPTSDANLTNQLRCCSAGQCGYQGVGGGKEINSQQEHCHV